jgi:hypothetical protein
MGDNHYLEEETVELDRPDLSVKAFARLLDIDVIERPDTRTVIFRRRRSPDRSDEVFRCLDFLEACHGDVAAAREALFQELIGKYKDNKITLAAVLVAQQAIELFALALMKALCQCNKSPPVPDQNGDGILDAKLFISILCAVFGVIIVLAAPAAAAAAGAAAAEAAAAAGASEAVAAAAGAAAAAATQQHWAVIGVVLASTGTILAGIFDRIIASRSDPDFDSVPTLREFKLPGVDLSALPDALATSLRQQLARAGESIAAGQALVAALDKFQGAVLADDGDARDRQLAAAADFAETLADSLEAQVAPRTVLVAALRSAGFVTVITTAQVLDAVVNGVPTGPPDAFRQVAAHYGVSDVDGLWLRAFSNPMAAVGVFPESLNPPGLAAAEIKAAASLRTSAAKWRG